MAIKEFLRLVGQEFLIKASDKRFEGGELLRQGDMDADKITDRESHALINATRSIIEEGGFTDQILGKLKEHGVDDLPLDFLERVSSAQRGEHPETTVIKTDTEQILQGAEEIVDLSSDSPATSTTEVTGSLKLAGFDLPALDAEGEIPLPDSGKQPVDFQETAVVASGEQQAAFSKKSFKIEEETIKGLMPKEIEVLRVLNSRRLKDELISEAGFVKELYGEEIDLKTGKNRISVVLSSIRKKLKEQKSSWEIVNKIPRQQRGKLEAQYKLEKTNPEDYDKGGHLPLISGGRSSRNDAEDSTVPPQSELEDVLDDGRLTTDSYRTASAEKVGWMELSLTELNIIYPLFEVNPEGTDFKFKFATEIASYIEETKDIDIKPNTVRNTIQNIEEKLVKLEGIPESVLPGEIRKFIEHVRNKPEFSKLSMTELGQLAGRKMPFSEVLGRMEQNDNPQNPGEHLLQRGEAADIRAIIDSSSTSNGLGRKETETDSSSVLTEKETYLLAKLLVERTDIGISPENMRVIKRIEESLRGKNKYEVGIKDMAALLEKVAQFRNSPKEVFTANGDDGHATGLLFAIHDLDEEKLRKLGLLQKK